MYQQVGGPTAYGAAYGMYGTTENGQLGAVPYDQVGLPMSKLKTRKRMNVVAVCVGLFVPWLVFCGVYAMLTFSWHYRYPALCQYVCYVLAFGFGLLLFVSIVSLIKRKFSHQHIMESRDGGPSWSIFLYTTTLVALSFAMSAGDYNYWSYMQPYYDLTNLNSYQQVDPARMRGQELMDAGRVEFVPGTHLDLKRAMSFKNADTYCVAPITGGLVEGNPPLASYDFFAVGKNCCPGDGGAFKCGAYGEADARSGVRLVQDADRAFYRLAVQQAQSTFDIKSIHPLFFRWVRDADEEVNLYRQEAFQHYLGGMFLYFAFQLLLVALAGTIFAKLGFH